MLGKVFAASVLAGYLLAIIVDSPRLAGFVSLALILAGAAYGGHRLDGWRGASVGIVGLACVSTLMFLVLGDAKRLP